MIRLEKIKKEDSTFEVSDVKITTDRNDLSLDELLPVIEDFLLACGYRFRGNLKVVDHE